MKTEQIEKKEQVDAVKQVDKKGKKSKAQGSKVSKASHATRRRQQPDSSEQCLLPADIPRSTYSQLIITEGFENELTKIVICVPFSQLKKQNFESVIETRVQTLHILFQIEKQQDNITILAKLQQNDKRMQIENEQKMREPTQTNNIQKIQQSSLSNVQEYVSSVNIWGKYVYLSSFESQNKGIKKILKSLSTIQYGQISKFKVRQVNSDLFLFLNLRVEQYLNEDYNGLINQGNTCYMNSYLQTLYHIPAFRNLVYEAQIQEQTKFPATLQELFFNLGTSQKSVSPDQLVKSFGWGKREAAIQQDAQQFSCLFFEVLEKKLNDSAPRQGYKNRTINKLFKGQLSHYIRCTQVGTVIDNTDFRNENYEEFIDLQLPIYPTLTESLDSYTTQVHLSGDNQYWTELYGKQQAYKGVKIDIFPPILMIQLKRFQYDFVQQKNVKILASLQFQEQLDFSKWSTSQQKQEYELYAVLVHEGARAESGHYYNFVRIENQWYKFNDQNVQKVFRQRVFDYNFGGFHESLDFDAKQMKTNKKFIESKTTAYMLVYIKKDLKEQLMLDKENLPEWIKNKNVYKLQMEEEKKNKKKFFHNVGFLNWETRLQQKTCANVGFLDEFILESSKEVIPQISKQMKLSQWLIKQKIIQLPAQQKQKQKEKKKKKSKKSKSESIENGDSKQPGIYVYYVNDRQNMTGFTHKNNHQMIDLLKISPDAFIFQAPFQAKKDEFIGIIKRYKVIREDGQILVNFTYETVIPIKKQITYTQLFNQFSEQFEISPSRIQGQPEDSAIKRQNYYIDDLRYSNVINISQQNGLIPGSSPKQNQLLVCVVEQICCDLSADEQLLYSFPRYYHIKKGIIFLSVSQEKVGPLFDKKQCHPNLKLPQIRKIIFDMMPSQKQSQYGSSQNIILKAKLKKAGKIYSEVSQPQYSTLKQITRHEEKIQFSFSSLTAESRLSQYEIQIYYRFKNLQMSEAVNLIANKNDTNETLVKNIKQHPIILQLLNKDGFNNEEADIFLMAKNRLIINDVVTNQGKVISKGDLDTVIKKQKNTMIVVQGRNKFQMQNESKIQIKEEDIQPIVNLLIHHISISGDKIGIPRFFKVDRRMQLSQLRTKLLDLIKDQIYLWENKMHVSNPFKVTILLFTKDSKKVIELTDLQSLQQMNRLKIQDKTSNGTQNRRKQSKQIKNSIQKQSIIDQAKQILIDLTEQNPKQQQVINGTATKDKTQIQKMEVYNQAIEISDDPIEKQKDDEQKSKQSSQKQEEQQKQGQAIQQQDITQISGPQTIYGIFPKQKILKVQIIHNYLTKPNIVLRLNVDD